MVCMGSSFARSVILAALCSVMMGMGASCRGAVRSEDLPVPLEGTMWMLSDLKGAAVSAGPGRPYIKMESGHLYGFGGCNRMGGLYELVDARLVIRKIAMTRLLCDRMEMEQAFVDALPRCDSLKQEGSRLVLKQHGEPVMIFETQSNP